MRVKSDEMRLIEKAEAETPGEQGCIVLDWADYRRLVGERDHARGLACEAFFWLHEQVHFGWNEGEAAVVRLLLDDMERQPWVLTFMADAEERPARAEE